MAIGYEAKTIKRFRAKVRRAVADYLQSEGCSCCRGEDHGKHETVLAELLNVPKYEDGSGHDFNKYASEPVVEVKVKEKRNGKTKA